MPEPSMRCLRNVRELLENWHLMVFSVSPAPGCDQGLLALACRVLLDLRRE